MKLARMVLACLLLIPCMLASGEDEQAEARQFITEGMSAYSQKHYAEAIEPFKKAFVLRPTYSAIAFNISCCYAMIGEHDSAFAWLEKAIELGVYKFDDDEDLAPLRENERFQELIALGENKIKELQSKEWKPIIELPEDYKTGDVYPVVIGLHGFGMNPVDFATSLKAYVLPHRYILCCPYGTAIRGTTSFGWGEYEAAEKRILDALNDVRENYSLDTSRIVLLGYSQGGGNALYTAFSNPDRFHAVISVAGYYEGLVLDSLLTQESAKNTSVYLMIGEKDYLFESNQKAEQAMQEHGMRVKLVVYPGLGHAFPANGVAEIGKALTWISE